MKQIQLLLENYVALLRVGTHAHERKAPQRVRVNISAALQAPPTADDLNETYDYTRFITAIDELSGQHFNLLESFAAVLAEKILSDGRLPEVEIELMKLDALENGQVGVRYRASK